LSLQLQINPSRVLREKARQRLLKLGKVLEVELGHNNRLLATYSSSG
jgi:hypothetical protein